jgi:signal transduction histidine kinase
LPSRIAKLLRTYSFRLAVLYIALFSISVLVLFGVIYWAMTGYMAREQDLSVDAELSSLMDVYSAGGTDRLVSAVNELIRSPNRRDNFALVQDSSGRRIAGNMKSLRPQSGWQNLPGPLAGENTDEAQLIRAKGVMLPAGQFLLAGEGDLQLRETRELVVRAFGWGGAMMGILALIGGIVMSAGLLRRVEAIRRTAEDIMAGNLSRRIPTRETGDDFDRLSASLNAMLDRIQQLMEGMRQVSNDIAHDLRTPLTRLRQRLEKARAKSGTVQEYQDLVDANLEEIDQILRTFAAMLRIAQIESGATRARFADLDLSTLLASIVDLYMAYAEDQKKILRGTIEPGVTIIGDRELVTQMVVNLLENALHHTPRATIIEVGLQARADRAVCTIADNGPGIPAEERDKVFRRFYRLDASRATAGSGLGLSLVAAVAALHQVRVSLADNEPGLRVSLEFPISR